VTSSISDVNDTTTAHPTEGFDGRQARVDAARSELPIGARSSEPAIVLALTRRSGQSARVASGESVARRAPYDEIAQWYEAEFLVAQRSAASIGEFADRLGIDQAVVELLGAGEGLCLEVGCGTGIYSSRVRELGWTPLGIDLSAGMLRFATDRLPVALADASSLPYPDAVFDAVLTVMVHTDLPAYAPVLSEIERVLKPGGAFVHIGVHPCFCGAFADRSDSSSIVVRPGYLDGSWTTESWTDQGLRDKVGASHLPVSALLNSIIAAGLTIEALSEGGTPTPIVLSARASKQEKRPSANRR
jgi:SAM-dependent methyltransferase